MHYDLLVRILTNNFFTLRNDSLSHAFCCNKITLFNAMKVTKFIYPLDEGRRNGNGVLVHCQAGISRSATVVIAFLMKHEGLTLNDAYKLVKEKRPVISPNINFMGCLVKFEKTSFRC